MASCSIRSSAELDGTSIAMHMAELWNQSATGMHGFFPISADLFETRILQSPRFDPQRLLLAYADGQVAGFLHYDFVQEPYYPHGGVVEAVAVAPAYRRQGLATALLREALAAMDKAGATQVDALGAFPYSPFYSTLADGSERSGPFLSDPAMLRLFENAGFVRERESLVMEHALATPPEPTRDEADLCVSIISREKENTWLDFIFRGWKLFSHILHWPSGQICSRAIFGRMEGVSNHTGEERYALFGVQTPPAMRGKGWATENLRRLLTFLHAKQVDCVELHVYADNTPAVRLYTGLGFRELDRTVILRRYQSI